jgi:hypothetical protein
VASALLPKTILMRASGWRLFIGLPERVVLALQSAPARSLIYSKDDIEKLLVHLDEFIHFYQ